MGIRYKIERFKFYSRVFFKAFLIFILLDIGFILGLMPDWHYYQSGPVSKSSFIKDYEIALSEASDMPKLKWQPRPIETFPKHLGLAVIVAEDSRFYQHNGIDTMAVKTAMQYNYDNKRFVYGGSTISQQMIKNMLLSPSRNPLRKWHEIWLTLSLEKNVSKHRILEIYLNIAEFGKGIYGVSSAAQHYWGKSVHLLTHQQSIELAATLSSPVRHNPKTQTDYFKKQVKKITRNMGYGE